MVELLLLFTSRERANRFKPHANHVLMSQDLSDGGGLSYINIKVLFRDCTDPSCSSEHLVPNPPPYPSSRSSGAWNGAG